MRVVLTMMRLVKAKAILLLILLLAFLAFAKPTADLLFGPWTRA